MKRIILFSHVALLFMLTPCQAGFFDNLVNDLLAPSQQQNNALDNSTIVKGLKEALATGTERAVKEVARTDGYFGNQLIKILLPARIQQAANLLSEFGYRAEVDEFVLSMNRAAEQAAPLAAGYFGDAIRQMTVEDARGILSGGETAATGFFEKKTRARLVTAFKPTVSKTMARLGTARAYQEMLGKYQAVPLAALAGMPSLDLDDYVTNKALDGLFKMVGEEEQKIRTNPAAQTSELLRKVFGGK